MVKQRNAKGQGSFKINSNGTVTHRKHVGYKQDGHRKILTVTASNKAQAIKLMKQKEKEWEEEQAQQSFEFYNGITVEELCEKHLAYQVSNQELTNKSWDRRETTIRNHISGGSVKYFVFLVKNNSFLVRIQI